MDNSDSIGHRQFDLEDQRVFAAMSGDVNPMHVDPMAARRTMYGTPVVHGVHIVLWALDVWCSASGSEASRLTKLTADFVKPVFVGDAVRVSIVDEQARTARLRVSIDEVVVTTVRVEFVSDSGDVEAEVDVAGEMEVDVGAAPSNLVGPRDRDIEDLTNAAGTVVAPAAAEAWSDTFPSLTARVGAECVAAVAALSTIVGMECPGLHSLFGGFSVRLTNDIGTGEAASAVHYRVVRANAKFSTLKIQVSSTLLHGEIRAFVRPRPTVQSSTEQLRSLVEPGEFSGVDALIVGGSRGLGEVSAKLIAAGGGRATVSWHRGRVEAERVVEDIRRSGLLAESTQIDVTDADLQLDPGATYTHLLYFASPRISARRLRRFDRDVFDGFVDAYVDGFVSVAEVVASQSEHLVVLYPSSVYVESGGPDFLEYAAAKAAGEVAAASWVATHPGATLHIERLAPLATDQTAALISVGASDAALPVLQMLRDMHSVGSGREQ